MRALELIFPAAVAACVFVGALTIFPWDSDASFIAHDPVFYAHDAEGRPWRSLVGHHPLFHVMVNVVTAALERANVAHPGHLAVRCVSGFGAACIVLLFSWIAGAGKRTTGALIALPLIASRTFIFEAGVGESIHTACAASLATLWLASRPDPRRLPVAISLVLALLLRQDNVLMVPAVAIAFASGQASGRRLRRTASLIGIAAVATLTLYLLAWRVSAPDVRLADYLLHVASPQWIDEMTAAPDSMRMLAHCAVSGVAVVGQQWDMQALPHVAVGVAFVALLVAAGVLLRGRYASGRFGVAVLLTIGARAPFFAWFEPMNHEWWLLPLVLIGALVASWARGDNGSPPARRRAGHLTLLLMTAAILAAHMPWTYALRDRSVAHARDVAMEAGARFPDCRYATFGAHAHTAFHVIRRDHLPMDGSIEATIDELRQVLSRGTAPIVLVLDRFAGTGMPHLLRQDSDPLASLLDDWKPTQGERLFRYRGRVIAIAWNLD